jgi:hypothetical protein
MRGTSGEDREVSSYDDYEGDTLIKKRHINQEFKELSRQDGSVNPR